MVSGCEREEMKKEEEEEKGRRRRVKEKAANQEASELVESFVPFEVDVVVVVVAPRRCRNRGNVFTASLLMPSFGGSRQNCRRRSKIYEKRKIQNLRTFLPLLFTSCSSLLFCVAFVCVGPQRDIPSGAGKNCPFARMK